MSLTLAPSSNRGIQTGNSLLRQYREKKDKDCWVRERPQAYFIFCDDESGGHTVNADIDNNEVLEPTPVAEGDDNRHDRLEARRSSIGRSRTASPYIEENHGNGTTILRRRIIDQAPKLNGPTMV